MTRPSTPSRKYIVRPLDGQNQEYEGLSANALVRDLKERIFIAQGVLVQNQKLIFGPEVMDDIRSLDSYYIPDGSVIRLLTIVDPSEAPSPPFDVDNCILKTVFIRPAANSHTTAMHDVRLDATVESFRKEYCQKQGTEAEYCRLLFSGKELEDVRNGKVMTLKDYGIGNENTIHEVYRLPGGRLPGGGWFLGGGRRDLSYF